MHVDEVVKEIRSFRLMMRRNAMRDHRRVFHKSGGVSKTKQGLRDGTDINKIMDRWLKHGTSVAHLNPRPSTYGDFSSGLDYAESLNRLKAAEADFAALPARVRAACGNDPAEFLQIVFDPERSEELEGLDLGDREKPRGDSEGVAGPRRPAPDVKEEDVLVVKGEQKAVPQGGE